MEEDALTQGNRNAEKKAFQQQHSLKTCASPIVLITAVVCFLVYPNACSSQQTFEEPSSKIVILKQRHILEFHQNGKPVRTYKVSLGLNSHGSKRVAGDEKTPEGEYFICYKNAASRFHRFLGISYPSAADAQTAFESGLISLDKRDYIVNSLKSGKAPPWDTALGGWVGIHGYPSNENQRIWVTLLYPKPEDWTDGCVAMWNFEIEELFPKVSLGTPVIISP